MPVNAANELRRRDFLKLTACALTASACPDLSHAMGGTSDDDRPNIILIMADDLGYGDISSYGGPIQTPNIDALVKSGMRFTDYHANAPVCSQPARRY